MRIILKLLGMGLQELTSVVVAQECLVNVIKQFRHGLIFHSEKK